MKQQTLPNPSHSFFAALLVSLIAFASPAFGQLFHQDVKLLPSDGEALDNFGWAIAVDDGLVVVGAIGDDDNGDTSGSAYVFNALTGDQIAKLLPSDGGANQMFGESVAIDNGIVVVGAPVDDDNGWSSGSAYVFDASSGAQLRKLVPSDGANGDRFGDSVAIDNGIVAVGATGDDDNGTDSGAAYLFNASTGAQISKLLPTDPDQYIHLGHSIAIDSGIVAVGAQRDNDNGNASGSAYLFSASSGQQLIKLLPSDGDWFGYFGRSIDIDNGVVAVGTGVGSAYLFSKGPHGWWEIAKLQPNDGSESKGFGATIAIDDGIIAVGAALNDDNGTDSGSAYFFDVGTGTQIAKLLPSDGAARQYFGYSVTIDKGIIAASALKDDDNGIVSGSAYVFAADSDGDGLYDFWETDGMDVNGDGVLDLNLLALGADPQRKDLFLEVDSMILRQPDDGVLDRVAQAFANAPVTNPDGTTGITLHILYDEDGYVVLRDYPNGFADFDVDKARHFGTVAEREDPNQEHILAAKRLVYRYCIFADQHSGKTSSGLGELGGNDLMITLGSRTPRGGTPDQQAGTLLHEFGHTLSLRHGGADNINFKPNYYSVMSYTWQSPKKGWKSSWKLDYSHEALPTLNESALSEPAGLGANKPGIVVPYSSGNRGALAKMGPGQSVDWDLDGQNDQNPVSVDTNYLYRGPNWRPSPGQTLVGHNDWANLQLNFRDSYSFADGAHVIPDDEMTLEIEDALDDLFPPECAADLNLDGVIDYQDFLVFLNAWQAREPLADWNDDDDINTLDFLAYLKAWVAGCP